LGNMAYCVKLSGEDLSYYLNKVQSVGLRKCPYYHYLCDVTTINTFHSFPHTIAEKQLA